MKCRTKFVITLHQKDTAILNLLKIYFGEVGNISHSKNSVSFWVSSLKELNDKILPHFFKLFSINSSCSVTECKVACAKHGKKRLILII